jgi:hypothetical protein
MDIGSEGNSMVQNRIVEPAVLRSDLLMFFFATEDGIQPSQAFGQQLPSQPVG